jgi:hypothetical protein
MNTYIGWSSGAPATENFFAFDFTPEKPLDAYEYVDVTETHTVADPNDPENATIEITTVVDKVIQERADWVAPEAPAE